ncbi:MAG: leucyl aminopeptidase [Firmicutes bacterium]|nr:leucyl aminopeptidase [Bacillota bacterium]MCL5038239.1 leucyl aminopeptidase [Bacillota bacterium]
MELSVRGGDIIETAADTIIINLFAGVTVPGGATGVVDKALGGAIQGLAADGEFKGELNELAVLHPRGGITARRVIVVGLGQAEELNLDRVRQAAGTAAKEARKKNAQVVASIVHGSGIGGLDSELAAAALVEGTLLGLYQFQGAKSKAEDQGIKQLLLVEKDEARLEAVRRGARVGQTLAEATNLARDITNQPANLMIPEKMALLAQEMARREGLTVTVLDEQEMEKKGMGALLGVARGSQEPPRLIVLRYQASPPTSKTVALVGKGLTFDSGGISLKAREGLENMKMDKAGGAAVLAAMQAIARLKPAINVLGIIAATENMPGGRAQKPGDVVRAMDGKTIEIISTDAEGRLILADAVTYARELNANLIVDVATLTGAVRTALGTQAAAIIANNQSLVQEVVAAGERAGERFWPLPTYPEYKEQYKSQVADIKNVGGSAAGTITGGLIIGEFAGTTPWAHLDIAGVAWGERELPYQPKGATGFSVRTLVNMVLSMTN